MAITRCKVTKCISSMLLCALRNWFNITPIEVQTMSTSCLVDAPHFTLLDFFILCKTNEIQKQ